MIEEQNNIKVKETKWRTYVIILLRVGNTVNIFFSTSKYLQKYLRYLHLVYVSFSSQYKDRFHYKLEITNNY